MNPETIEQEIDKTLGDLVGQHITFLHKDSRDIVRKRLVVSLQLLLIKQMMEKTTEGHIKMFSLHK